WIMVEWDQLKVERDRIKIEQDQLKVERDQLHAQLATLDHSTRLSLHRLGEVESERNRLRQELDAAESVLHAIHASRVFRLMRRLGRWGVARTYFSRASQAR